MVDWSPVVRAGETALSDAPLLLMTEVTPVPLNLSAEAPVEPLSDRRTFVPKSDVTAPTASVPVGETTAAAAPVAEATMPVAVIPATLAGTWLTLTAVESGLSVPETPKKPNTSDPTLPVAVACDVPVADATRGASPGGVMILFKPTIIPAVVLVDSEAVLTPDGLGDWGLVCEAGTTTLGRPPLEAAVVGCAVSFVLADAASGISDEVDGSSPIDLVVSRLPLLETDDPIVGCTSEEDEDPGKAPNTEPTTDPIESADDVEVVVIVPEGARSEVSEDLSVEGVG